MEADEGSLREELELRRRPAWRTPFHWWGPPWLRPRPRALPELVEDGVLDVGTAEALAREIRAGGSVVVAAGPSGVGKSTLADALARELPTGTEPVYVRGGHETFAFLAEPPAGRRTMLVNELSPHLPVYLWGEAARRVLRLARDGGQVIGTMHASTPEEVVYQLSRSPVGAAPDEVAALGTVVFLGPPVDGGERWTVSRVVRLAATAQGINVEETAIDR